ncbi:phytanoyl-CoA dioxygenase family protein [Candidatus Poribacteria bacterium]|nr:MAG: phytanoyl-CoA dioxygenase family protein [Candidatus Poribacteria bacterium]
MSTQRKLYKTDKVMPTQEELDRIGRVLKFFPSVSKHPNTLTLQQVWEFNNLGYISGITIFNETEMRQHRKYFDSLLEDVLSQGGSSYSIISAHMKYGKVFDLLNHPKIVSCVSDILGEDVIGWGAHYFCKMPYDTKIVGWHQDAGYWPLTPSKTITVWLAIDDATVENGAMRFVAGSHLLGHITSRQSKPDENSILSQIVEDVNQYGDIVDNELQAGEISIHTDLLLHGSNANPSPNRRCGLTLRYCTPDVIASYKWDREGVVVSGIDKDGHWGNPSRPYKD